MEHKRYIKNPPVIQNHRLFGMLKLPKVEVRPFGSTFIGEITTKVQQSDMRFHLIAWDLQDMHPIK